MTSPFLDYTRTNTEGVARVPTAPAAGVPFWGDSPESWDTVTIAGRSLPGICTVTGKAGRRVDRRQTPGKHGTTVTYLGDAPAEFTITLKLWTAEHLAEYQALLEFLRSVDGPMRAAAGALPLKNLGKLPRSPVDIIHPTLSLLRIRAAHVIEYDFPRAAGDVYEASIKCIEHGTSNSGVGTPKGAVDSSILSRGPGAIGRRLLKPSQTNGGP